MTGRLKSDFLWSESKWVHEIAGVDALSGASLPADPLRHPFIDTGHTYSQLETSLFQAFKKQFDTFCAAQSMNCGGLSSFRPCYYLEKGNFRTAEAFFSSFPEISFRFGKSGELSWSPREYLTPNPKDPEMWCVGVIAGEYSAIGSLFLQNREVVIRYSKRSVRIARKDCPRWVEGVPPRRFSDLLVLRWAGRLRNLVWDVLLRTPALTYLTGLGLGLAATVYGCLFGIVGCILW